ncbi:hypothetical protein SANTM175S_02774 [Streptomyces antimycoticus]
MHEPLWRRVCRSPSSSSCTHPEACPTSWNCQISGVSRAICAADPLLVLLVGEVRAQRAAAIAGPPRLDALAALAEDAGPPGGQPGQIASEELLVVGRIGEFDPCAGEVQTDFVLGGPAAPASSAPDGIGSSAAHFGSVFRPLSCFAFFVFATVQG